jgi:hypothetical protein
MTSANIYRERIRRELFLEFLNSYYFLQTLLVSSPRHQ